MLTYELSVVFDGGIEDLCFQLSALDHELKDLEYLQSNGEPFPSEVVDIAIRRHGLHPSHR